MTVYISGPHPELNLQSLGVKLMYWLNGFDTGIPDRPSMAPLKIVPKDFDGPVCLDYEGEAIKLVNYIHKDLSHDTYVKLVKGARKKLPNALVAPYGLPIESDNFEVAPLRSIALVNGALWPVLKECGALMPSVYPIAPLAIWNNWKNYLENICETCKVLGCGKPTIAWVTPWHRQGQWIQQRATMSDWKRYLEYLARAGMSVNAWYDGAEYYITLSCRTDAGGADERDDIAGSKREWGDRFAMKDGSPDREAIRAYILEEQGRYMTAAVEVFGRSESSTGGTTRK